MDKQGQKPSQINNSGIDREIFGNKFISCISRRITELLPNLTSKAKKSPFFKDIRIIILNIATVVLLSMIFINLINTINSIKLRQKNEKERTKLTKEIDYWQGIVKKYQGYRDGYLKLALLEYQFNNFEKSKSYLDKALSLDPNFEIGRKFEVILDRSNL